MRAGGPSQALNLGNAPSPYGDSFMSLDLMKGAEPWSYWTEGIGGRYVPEADQIMDKRGWLTTLPVVDGVETGVYANIFYGRIQPAGPFILEWKGKGSIEVEGPYEVIGKNRIRFDFAPEYVDAQGNPTQDGITVVINGTDPDGTGNYLRDIKLYRAEDADLIAAGERFDPDWMNAIDDFRILRTHDWQYTNFPATVDWSRNVVAADQAVWGLDGRGMPYEVMVDTANETRSDIWVNMPHTASDAYIRAAAIYLRDNLAPGLRVHAEFSNEHFTTIFDQYQFFQDGGRDQFGTAPSAAAQFYGTQSARMDAIFDDVFAGQQGRLRTVVTVDSTAFLSDAARLMLTAPASIAQGGASPVSAGVEVLATDGYLFWWTPSIGDDIRDWMTDADGGFQRAADYLMDQLVNELIPSWQAGRALADEYGLEFMVYEGGTLLLNGADFANVPQDLTDFAAAFSLSEELEPVYAAMAAAWAEIGTGPFAWYNDTGRAGPWGSYGHWDSITFDPHPRTGAIIDANGDRPWWDGDTRPGSTFDNGRYDAGSAGADAMRGMALGDRLYGLSGRDLLAGGKGGDVLWGDDGADAVRGQSGADTLVGGDGRDLLLGGRGADSLSGGRGVDLLTGDAGADVLNGGDGADVLRGGAGDDVFVFDGPADGVDRIVDFWQRGAGGDDSFALSGRGFDLIGLTASAFQASNAARAQSSDVRIIHDRDDGHVLFDADGQGGDRAVLLATLRVTALITVEDFAFY